MTRLLRGVRLDRHVISSRPTGCVGERMQFETTRSPLGEGFAKEARLKRNRSMFKYYAERGLVFKQ